MARTSVDASAVLGSMAKEVLSIDPAVAIGTSGTLENSLREFYRGPQFELVTLTAFSVIGLVLVVIGVFSVMGYTVSLQAREIGIRLALGAQQRNILRLVLLNGLRLVVAGIFLGLLASYALTRFLATQISGVSASDPTTFAAVVTIAVSAGLTPCFLPARPAAPTQPPVPLRYEKRFQPLLGQPNYHCLWLTCLISWLFGNDLSMLGIDSGRITGNSSIIW